MFPEEGFFRKTFGFFLKNTSSGMFLEHVLPEVPEEPITDLPEASPSAPFPHFFRHLLLSSSTLCVQAKEAAARLAVEEKARGRGKKRKKSRSKK
ncbi:hypothetical protein HKD37_06G017179 [Glycine soja]